MSKRVSLAEGTETRLRRVKEISPGLQVPHTKPLAVTGKGERGERFVWRVTGPRTFFFCTHDCPVRKNLFDPEHPHGRTRRNAELPATHTAVVISKENSAGGT